MILKRFRREKDGPAVVDLALLSPVLAIITGGVIQVATLAQTAVIASNAAREGVRYAAVSSAYAAAMASTYAANGLGGRTDVTVGAVTVTWIAQPGGTKVPGLPGVTVLKIWQ